MTATSGFEGSLDDGARFKVSATDSLLTDTDCDGLQVVFNGRGDLDGDGFADLLMSDSTERQAAGQIADGRTLDDQGSTMEARGPHGGRGHKSGHPHQ